MAGSGWKWSMKARKKHKRRMRRMAKERMFAKQLSIAASPKGPTPEVELSILDEAKEIIYGDREKTYGAPSKNLRLIAASWGIYLSARSGIPYAVLENDVCIMMVLLKMARLASDPKHRDSQVDACGYLALLERIQRGK